MTKSCAVRLSLIVQRAHGKCTVHGIFLLCLHSYWSSSVAHEKGTFVCYMRGTLISLWRALGLIEQ